ncbi:hypothetical protein B0H66DRAFT_227551 [Apodospora peruviana]|uniref:Secreted protein n=1 Tax=Apodospora peruviana TaxID=516989 RepID=A0AAE0M3P2_9PEZI|nr:hypothetical protein B0H66DRAFT_227551 [Apodospora peruviana]
MGLARCRFAAVITLTSLFGIHGVIAAPAPQVTATPVASGAPNANACAAVASATDAQLAARHIKQNSNAHRCGNPSNRMSGDSPQQARTSSKTHQELEGVCAMAEFVGLPERSAVVLHAPARGYRGRPVRHFGESRGRPVCQRV